MSTEHPMALELVSLKAALDKYQHAAHTSSLQLQRAHFESAEATSRSKLLESNNARLRHEVEVLRATSDSTSASLQVSELTLALRRISVKLSLTEDILLKRTTELTHALSEKSRVQLENRAARTELARARQREEAFHLREEELEQKFKAAEEEARMADLVVMEYADLVRSLEGRMRSDGTSVSRDLPLTSNSCPMDGDTHESKGDSLVHSLRENRFSLQRLLHEFNAETSNLQAEISRLHTELSSVRAELNSERENSELDRIKLAEALVDVHRCKTDDGAAVKVVSRYMQFSQSSIQTALETIKSRHAITLATMSSSSESLTHSLTVERNRAAKLRDVLDVLTEDISRETYGRRREVSLRLQSLVREERTVKTLDDWVRRAESRRAKLPARISVTDLAGSSGVKVNTTSEELESALDSMIQDALAILASLSHEQVVGDVEGTSSLARLILAEEMVRSLAADLEQETEKRMYLARTVARENFEPPSASSGEAEVVLSHDCERRPSSDSGDASPTLEEISPPGSDSGSKLTPSPPVETFETIDPSGVGAVGDATEETVAVPHIASHSLQTEPQDQGETISDLADGVAHSNGREPSHIELSQVSHRYDGLQHAFHDCHLVLVKLKADIAPTSSTSNSNALVVKTVIHRLYDFCEDTRVELEIRIADEERIIRGFVTLLSVSSGDEENARVDLKLKAFLNGTDPSVVKVVESSTSKLEDLQHDIAQIKRIMHESMETPPEFQYYPAPKTPPRWSSWTPPFLSASPTKSTNPAPSFGTVITAPRPRRMPSKSLISYTPNVADEPSLDDPYARLGLRIPMPSQVYPTSVRHRKTSASNMYLLGLGSSSGFFSRQDAIPEGAVQPVPPLENGESEIFNSESDVE